MVYTGEEKSCDEVGVIFDDQDSKVEHVNENSKKTKCKTNKDNNNNDDDDDCFDIVDDDCSDENSEIDDVDDTDSDNGNDGDKTIKGKRGRKLNKAVKWSDEESKLLQKSVLSISKEMGSDKTGLWARVAKLFDDKTSKHCRERWKSVADPRINRSEWTMEEDLKIMKLHSIHGTSWSLISKELDRRPELSVKTRCISLKRAQRRFWTAKEDAILALLYQLIGQDWVSIGKHLPGRKNNAMRSRIKLIQTYSHRLVPSLGDPAQTIPFPTIEELQQGKKIALEIANKNFTHIKIPEAFITFNDFSTGLSFPILKSRSYSCVKRQRRSADTETDKATIPNEIKNGLSSIQQLQIKKDERFQPKAFCAKDRPHNAIRMGRMLPESFPLAIASIPAPVVMTKECDSTPGLVPTALLIASQSMSRVQKMTPTLRSEMPAKLFNKRALLLDDSLMKSELLPKLAISSPSSNPTSGTSNHFDESFTIDDNYGIYEDSTDELKQPDSPSQERTLSGSDISMLQSHVNINTDLFGEPPIIGSDYQELQKHTAELNINYIPLSASSPTPLSEIEIEKISSIVDLPLPMTSSTPSRIEFTFQCGKTFVLNNNN